MEREPAKSVLVVDDEAAVRFGVREYLTADGYEVAEASRQDEARELVAKRNFGAILLDMNLPDGSGLDLLREIRASDPAVPVLIITGHGTIARAVEAMREGADHFLTKPVDMKELEVILGKSLRIGDLRRENRSLRERPAPAEPYLGESPAIRKLDPLLNAATHHLTPVLLRGETGTGKGLLARLIHDRSPNRAEPFVELNCAGLRGEFLESELFGHTKGAFTGASERKEGLLERAHRGTLFLDEIGDMDLAVQAKFLKVLEEKRFRPMGSVDERRSDFRMICATLQDLEQRIAQGTFRRDLLFRINMLTLTLPPLRERMEDLSGLVAHALNRIAHGKRPPDISPEAEAMLRSYPWPGNIRELNNVLERAYILSDGKTLRGEQFASLGPPLPQSGASLQEPPVAPPTSVQGDGAPEDHSLNAAEKRHILSVLQQTRGGVPVAAKLLGVSRATLYRKIAEHNIQLDDIR